jgi:hypothetical protein
MFAKRTLGRRWTSLRTRTCINMQSSPGQHALRGNQCITANADARRGRRRQLSDRLAVHLSGNLGRIVDDSHRRAGFAADIRIEAVPREERIGSLAADPGIRDPLE